MCRTPEQTIYSACWLRGLRHHPEHDQLWHKIIGAHVGVWSYSNRATAVEAASAIMTDLEDRGVRFAAFDFNYLIDRIAEILCHAPKARCYLVSDRTFALKRSG